MPGFFPSYQYEEETWVASNETNEGILTGAYIGDFCRTLQYDNIVACLSQRYGDSEPCQASSDDNDFLQRKQTARQVRTSSADLPYLIDSKRLLEISPYNKL